MELKLKILTAFFPEGKEHSMKEIEKRSGYSHERVYTLLQNLKKQKIVTERKIGKMHTYKLNYKKDEVLLAFTNYVIIKRKLFAKKYPLLYKRLKEFTNNVKSNGLILFGSYAKRKAKGHSDIDIAIVFPNISDFFVLQLDLMKLRRKIDLRIEPHLFSIEDFNKNNPLASEIFNTGIELKIKSTTAQQCI